MSTEPSIHNPTSRIGFESSYRSFLEQELAERCRRNPRYSLRAFARDLKISPSRLSEVLHKDQGISRSMAHLLSERLGLSDPERRVFCDLVESAHARSPKHRDEAQARLARLRKDREIRQLEGDVFAVIADWYHLALLELFDLRRYEDDPAWIARTLGVSLSETTTAIERLIRLGLLRRDGTRLERCSDRNFAPPGVSRDAMRKFHKQVLSKAADALVLQHSDEREFGAWMFAIDKSRLPEAKEMLREFQRRFCRQMGTDAGDDVYCFATQLFRLTTPGSEGKTT